MAWKALGLSVVVVWMIPASSGANPARAVAERATIVVRVFEQDGVPPRSLDSAAREAQAIFNRIGLEVGWTFCVGAKHPAACEWQIGADELVVRIVTAPAATMAGSVAMGYALVAPGSRHASLATVYFDLVQSTARSALADPGRLLGRAIAHEIGHLLLNTSQHAGDGLMRAVWSQSEMRRERSRDWRFDDHEATLMKASLSR